MRARAAAAPGVPAGAAAQAGAAAPAGAGASLSAWRELSVGLLSLTLLGEEYVAFRRGGALVATRCADGTEVFARYEGLACNTSAWRRLTLSRTRTLALLLALTLALTRNTSAGRRLRAGEPRRAAATRTLARGGKWRWQQKHNFVFHADGRLDTPWHKGVWGTVHDRSDADFVFARASPPSTTCCGSCPRSGSSRCAARMGTRW